MANTNPATIPLASVSSRNVQVYITDEIESGWVVASSFKSIDFDIDLNIEYYTPMNSARKIGHSIVPNVSGTIEGAFVNRDLIKKFQEMQGIDCGVLPSFTIVADICFPEEKTWHRIYIRNAYLPTLSIRGGEAALYNQSLRFEQGTLEVVD